MTPARIAIRETAAIARAIAAGHTTPERIAAATGMDAAHVTRRLYRSGPGNSRAAFRLYTREPSAEGWRWGLTYQGWKRADEGRERAA